MDRVYRLGIWIGYIGWVYGSGIKVRYMELINKLKTLN